MRLHAAKGWTRVHAERYNLMGLNGAQTEGALMLYML